MQILTRQIDLTIGTDAVEVSPQRSNPQAIRKMISLENNSPAGQTIRICFGDTASSTKGFNLGVGGYWIESEDLGVPMTQDQITAIGSVAGAILSVQERVANQGR